MSSQATSSDQIIALHNGGGVQKGLGEKFWPDLQTGTGNFTVPFAFPPKQNSFQTQRNLGYSTGNKNGSFGIGWSVTMPGVMRKISKGTPHYRDIDREVTNWDTFVHSRAENLVPVKDPSRDPLGATRFRRRTEGHFAKVIHHHAPKIGSTDLAVCRKQGLKSYKSIVRLAPMNRLTTIQRPAA